MWAVACRDAVIRIGHLDATTWDLRLVATQELRSSREAHVSAQQEAPFDEARFPGAHVDPRRPRRSEGPSAQGPSPAVGLIGRLNRSHEFQRLRSEGTRVRSGFLWCVMLRDPSLPAPQVAFAIGRPFGSAVRRNRLRRQLRAILTTRENDLGPGMFLIGVNNPSRHTPLPSFAQLSSDVEGILAKGQRR